MTWTKMIVLGLGYVLTACGPSQTAPVITQVNHTDQLDRLAIEVRDLNARRMQALGSNQGATAARLSLDLNEHLEQAKLIANQQDSEAARLALTRKYQILRHRLATRQAALSRQSLRPPSALSRAEDLLAWEYPIAYHPLELEATQDILEKFGDLYIDPKQLVGASSAQWQTMQAPRPWAGYWYPIRDTVLFAGTNSPLAKFDTLMARQGYPSQAAQWEREKWQTAVPDAWEGLCGAWAIAAITTPEPQAPLTAHGVSLTVADQKGLLTKIHESAPSLRYGIRYKGNYETDGTIQDVRPEAFHRIATALLSEANEAFVIDVDPGVEVWQQPVFRMDWQIRLDPEVANSLRVKARVLSVAPRNRQSDQLTSGDDTKVTTYDYRLYVDDQARPGQLKVIAGEWRDDSLGQHPDFIVAAEPQGRRQTFNPELTRHLARLEAILGL